ncbi:ABC-F family ATP-binding cassette domain-containing protein [Candidatus Saccharibacteria bacterium]|nr:ABC-F family ATP-binding cassette domain-containing protein [Candidatus Saccharibacteria bacterium]
MISDITISEKSFGPKSLMSNVRFTINDGEKIGVIGRNGVGKSTLFGILAGMDKDFTGDIIYKPGTVIVATQQEYHDIGDKTVLQYVLQGLPEYSTLSHIIETYPLTMGDDMKKINTYSEALVRFDDKGFYQIEEQIERELSNFQLPDVAHREFSTLSGGQKRLVEVVKIMHSDADLALVDEPTNHMDYIAKDQFIEWLKGAKEGALLITHDRDVLREVDRIIELKDGGSQAFKGNYDAYLKQNAVSTGSQMNEFEMVEKRINNLKSKVIEYQRFKEKSRHGGTIQRFKRLEEEGRKELAELQTRAKPTFWIDKDSVDNLNYKVAAQYDKFKAKNVRINLKSDESRSKHVLISARDLSLGYDKPLFTGINIDLREGEAIEFRGRNGAGKTTLIKAILGDESVTTYGGELSLDKQVRVGIYEQEVSDAYFDMPLEEAIERMYLNRELPISTTKIRSIMSDYLFSEGDGKTPVKRLSGGQKARFQLIAMLANDPQLLILDEPTNHLDLPSVEELETALGKYSGAIIYVSHDGYFRDKLSGEVLKIGAQ